MTPSFMVSAAETGESLKSSGSVDRQGSPHRPQRKFIYQPLQDIFKKSEARHPKWGRSQIWTDFRENCPRERGVSV